MPWLEVCLLAQCSCCLQILSSMEEKKALVPADRSVKVCNEAATQGRYNLHGYVSGLSVFFLYTLRIGGQHNVTSGKYWVNIIGRDPGCRPPLVLRNWDVSLFLSFVSGYMSIQPIQLKEVNKDHEIPVPTYDVTYSSQWKLPTTASHRKVMLEFYLILITPGLKLNVFPEKNDFFLFCMKHGSHVFHIFYSQYFESLAVM